MAFEVYSKTVSFLLSDSRIYIPDHQRPYVWDAERASRFIETVVDGLPTHSLMMSQEVVDGTIRHSLEDGQQRWFTIKKFISGEFGEKVTYDGRMYKDLSDTEKNAILNYPLTITMMNGISREKRLALFQKLQDGKPLSNGQRFYACRTYMDLVKFAEKIMKDPRTVTSWGNQLPDTPTNFGLSNAMAIASGVCYADPNTILTSYDILGKKMFDTPHFDEDAANTRLQMLYDVFARADQIFRCPPKEKNNEWKVGTYIGYILYTMILDGRDWVMDKEMWAQYIASVRRDPTAGIYLTSSIPKSRNWTTERWQKGVENVERVTADPTWFPTRIR